ISLTKPQSIFARSPQSLQQFHRQRPDRRRNCGVASASAHGHARGETHMYDFNRLLDWKLLRGSHQFPGPDGGTCLVQAAIVAPGYPYGSVGRADGRAGDLPVSFSWPLVSYAVCLNDAISDDALRQELLLPFVTRFAGSADTPQVEARRVR